MTTTAKGNGMYWLDKNGNTLNVGDWVRLGLAEGKILILEELPVITTNQREPAIYVTNLGHWGDCTVIATSRVEKMSA